MTAAHRIAVVAVAIAGGVAVAAAIHHGTKSARHLPPAPLVSAAGELTTSRTDLDRSMRAAEQRLAANPADGRAALTFAQASLRRARVESNGGYTLKAQRVLEEVLRREPSDYDALKMLGAVYMSQHRFRQAIETATRATRVHPKEAWNYGVIGDANIELGDYNAAFNAFDTMMRLRPDAAAYARVSYAQELQGRLSDAITSMRMAAEATGVQDPEAVAWHYAQIGSLLLQIGDVDGAAREFARAGHAFPEHPFVEAGMARVAAARGQYADALKIYRALMSKAPSSEIAIAAGDLLLTKGDEIGAQAMYARAEAIERDAWLTEARLTTNLARMLAERGARTDEAVMFAEEAARSRKDIFTMDALAWAYFRAGRLDEAEKASRQARRTGTADRRILTHASAIDAARGAAVVHASRPTS
jgi:tetratricopeptide (TPR) repeat protein